MRKIQAAIHADDDFHYQKLGLTRNKVEIWEDGMRTDGSKGTYEWWYFDSSYPDGTKLIIFLFGLLFFFLPIISPLPCPPLWRGNKLFYNFQSFIIIQIWQMFFSN